MNPILLQPFLKRVVRGDCIEVMRRLPAACIDLVITDPPYLVRYRSRDGRSVPNDDNQRWLLPAFREVARVLKPDSFCVSFYGWSRADCFLQAWRGCGLYPVGHFVWTKRYASRESFTRMQHEQAYLLAKGRPARPRSPLPGVLPWEYSGNQLHPTQKPVGALVPLIETFSEPKAVVLDPFAGSGSTGVAARIAGRHFVLIEQDWQYHQTASERLNRRR